MHDVRQRSTVEPNTIPERITDYAAEQIYQALSRQTFADWYEGQFVDHISESEEFAPPKSKILADIKRIFRLDQLEE